MAPAVRETGIVSSTEFEGLHPSGAVVDADAARTHLHHVVEVVLVVSPARLVERKDMSFAEPEFPDIRLLAANLSRRDPSVFELAAGTTAVPENSSLPHAALYQSRGNIKAGAMHHGFRSCLPSE